MKKIFFISIFIVSLIVMPLAPRAMQATDASKISGASIDEAQIQKTIYVNSNGDDNNDGSQSAPFGSVRKGFVEAQASINDGVATKLIIGEGVYREAFVDGIAYFSEGLGNKTLLVIEGEKAGKVVIAGSDIYGEDKWQIYDKAKNIYVTDWPYNFGFQTVNFGSYGPQKPYSHRSEMVFADGQPLQQVLIERHDFWNNSCGKNSAGELTCKKEGANLLGADPNSMGTWDYQGFSNPSSALTSGSFGVAERGDNGNKLYVRLPNGQTPSDTLVEVAVRKHLLAMAHKENIVIRNLIFKHTASHDSYAVAIKEHVTDGETRPVVYEFALGFDGYTEKANNNILIDNVHVQWSNSHALALVKTANITVRNSSFNYNGYNGVRGDTTNMVWENNDTSFNGWRAADGTATGSWYIAGLKIARSHDVLFKNSTAYGNLAPGLWCDIVCTNLVFDGVKAAYNSRNVFIELGIGPYLVKNSVLGPASKESLLIANASSAVVDGSLIYGDTAKTEESSAFSILHYQRNDNHAKAEPRLKEPRDIMLKNSVIVSPKGQQNTVKFHNGFLRDDPAFAMLNDAYSGTNNIFYSHNSADAFKHYKPGGWEFTNSSLSGWIDHIVREQNATFVAPKFKNPLALDFTIDASSPASNNLSNITTFNLNTDYGQLNQKLYDYFTWMNWDKFDLSVFNASAPTGIGTITDASPSVQEPDINSQNDNNSENETATQNNAIQPVSNAPSVQTVIAQPQNEAISSTADDKKLCQVSSRDLNASKLSYERLCRATNDSGPYCAMLDAKWVCANVQVLIPKKPDIIEVDNSSDNVVVESQTSEAPVVEEPSNTKCEVHSGDYNGVMQRFSNECKIAFDESKGHGCTTIKNVWYCTTDTSSKSSHNIVNQYGYDNQANALPATALYENSKAGKRKVVVKIIASAVKDRQYPTLQVLRKSGRRATNKRVKKQYGVSQKAYLVKGVYLQKDNHLNVCMVKDSDATTNQKIYIHDIYIDGGKAMKYVEHSNAIAKEQGALVLDDDECFKLRMDH